ncbi:MAG: diguanylate cyclase [Clostridia bacterium]|nr:diguanylate cyclase [Clostridia bacterium]
MSSKILIVDDNSLITKSVTRILENEGYTVCSTGKGKGVLELTYELKPDLILLDIILPDIDGFEVCRQLKSESTVEDIPIIMITSKTDGNDLKKALELGAFDYIKKPIDKVEVAARVQSALRFKQYHDNLKEMATKDALTGTYNHALLVELLEKELEKKKRKGGSVAFCMLDIDFFKKINDTFGHLTGDAVLKELARILTGMLRNSDIVGRYGGEEFGIVLPDIDAESTARLCERIRNSIKEHIFKTRESEIKITVSMGVSFLPAGAAVGCAEMIKKADDALYRAKQNGRNRVEFY